MCCHHHQIDPSASCSVTSAQIEQCYSRNQRGVMEFYTAKYTYRLDFSSKEPLGTLQTGNYCKCKLTGTTFSSVMRQINVTTGKQRPIKRSLHSATGFRYGHRRQQFTKLNSCSRQAKVGGENHFCIIGKCSDVFPHPAIHISPV